MSKSALRFSTEVYDEKILITAGRLLWVLALYILTCGGIHLYFYQQAKRNADEINGLVQKREQ